ncbi:MAG: FAD-dependent oxidoreductase [Hyphomicrobium sp.]|uniref:oxidoreductase n=1 Tax=Hyphomicrobium sp. TaxID=82 RepID=UPI003D1009FD
MPATPFKHLFTPLKVGGVTIKNRIMSTGHDTTLPKDGTPNDALVAYQKARAEGGCGLIVLQVAGVHESARYTSHILMATTDACIPGYRRIAEVCHAAGATVFGQLFHPGREIMESQDGSLPVAWAPSAVPNERFHVMPRPLTQSMIDEIVTGYGAAAERLKRAGIDGVEIVASHGYLPSQFLNPRVNRRTDRYGGPFENRMRFLRETIAAIRDRVGPDFVVGLRISGDDLDHDGQTAAEALEALMALDREGGLDYYNVIAGSSATLAGAVHIVPPMIIEAGYVAPFAAAVKAKVSKPVFVTGRINQPQIAEQILAQGQADICGMTRAQICDPAMARKAEAGKLDDIRACIGCNQACIGHFHAGYPISCIQHPETGRELLFAEPRPKAAHRRRILIAGGGPGGMKAAAVAAERGHDVTLHEATERLGGQALLAQALPGRAEFGGIVTNLAREMELAGVKVVKRSKVDRALVERERPDVVVVATGARPYQPEIEGAETAHLVTAWQVLKGEANVGASVAIADWRCDWIGLGLAEKLARDGCRVRLLVDGLHAGQRLPFYVRDSWNGILNKLGVEVTPYARLYGVDGTTAYFQHATSAEPILLEGVDTVVTALGHERVAELEAELEGWTGEMHVIGDCATPRTAEEAVLEGLKVGTAV